MNRTSLPIELPSAIADALDQGATVITANQRAARTLRYGFDERNRRMGLPHWQPAAVLSWDIWIAGCWQNLLVKGEVEDLLLNRTQEHAIWRTILSADLELIESLRSPDSLAELASHAWELLVRHGARHRLRGAWSNSETRALQRWASEFENWCQTQRLMPRALAESALKTAILEGKLRFSGAILLVGFDEFTPAQQMLVNAIATTGTSIEEFHPSLSAENKMFFEAEDEMNEITSAARWAKKILEDEPTARIGIIVPSLGNQRNRIDRIFREVLAPELEDIQASNFMAPYEFSIGTPLSERPMIRIALDIIQWTIAPLPLERVSALLISPFFAMREDERSTRALFDALDLRKSKLLLPNISIPWLTNAILRSKRRSYLFSLLSTLKAITNMGIHPVSERRSYTEWTDVIRNLLQVAGWGRSTGENSIEFQTRHKWESVLDELATLDFSGSQVSLEQVYRDLERLARLTVFAPESHNAPVQLMGPLEAAGSTLDAIWFLGAGDLEWPSQSSPNPLLPRSLQRELGVPGTNFATDDARARRLLERVTASAPTVVFSYAIETDKGTQRLSPLLRSLSLEKISTKLIAPPAPEPQTVVLEEFSDTTPLPFLQDEILPGGAEVLRLQAACGFRAFVERRLGSSELRRIELGMDASERGNVVHRALEHFWKRVRSQAALKAMTSDERSVALAQSIEYALGRIVSTTAWEHAYVELQRARLWSLLNPWLELELKREPFTVKLSEEESRDAHIGPLRLNLRVDRIDVTESGEIILDYKTGAAKPADWLGDRPDEPQLPLYAVVAKAAQPEPPLANIAFAHIRAGKDMSLEGFTNKITVEKPASRRTSISLEEQLVEWRRVLEELAIAFYRGNARVDPKSYPSTCAYCAQRILCRLNPAAFDEDLDEEAAASSANG